MYRRSLKFFISAFIPLIFVNFSVYGNIILKGQDYIDLGGEAVIQPDGKVEVLEFFWFGCPSCFRFEPFLLAWEVPEYIDFKNVPATITNRWEFHAHVYYAFELLGLKDQLMAKFYDELHVNRNRIRNLDQLTQWASAQDGVDAEKLAQTLNSFAVITKVSQASLLAKKFGISGVPTLVVGSKYLTSPSMVNSEARAIEIAEYLAREILVENSIIPNSR